MKKKILAVVMIAMLVSSAPLLAACNRISNEKTAFTIATTTLDGVFNPFFYTSATDGSVAGITQLSLFTNDGDKVAYGEEYDCAALALEQDPVDNRPANTSPEYTKEMRDKDFDRYYTTYTIILKKDLKFSDGSPLTIKDVLFNYYVYLDPVYSGSSTLYSVDIKGLAAYRTGTEDETLQENINAYFMEKARARRDAIIAYCNTEGSAPASEAVAADIATVKRLFREELATDWASAVGSLESYNEQYAQINEPWKAFLLYQGKITEDPNDSSKVLYNGYDTYGVGKTKDEVLDRFFDDMLGVASITTVKENLKQIVMSWGTAQTSLNDFAAQEKTKYFEELKDDGNLDFSSISGITWDDHFTGVVDGVTYTDYEMVRIEVNGVDPKAVWNLGVTIAPMKYYSSPEQIELFDGVDHFGVDTGNINFFNDYVRARMVPIGAGPYKATSASNSDSPTHTQFYNNNIVYYVRNEHFLMGAPKIKYLRYKVISSNQLLSSVKRGEVHFADPTATKDNLEEISRNNKLTSIMPEFLGYGYIGVSAKHVKDINIRRAIMMAMDVSLCRQFFQFGAAEIIYMPMSTTSWAYPKGITSNRYTFDPENYEDKIKAVIEQYTNYTVNESTGILTDGSGDKLEFEFTIAGATATDHPTYNTFIKAADILNNLYGTNKGFKIRVVTDSAALSKLGTGRLQVWAAAWGSTIDPDMFQVYHMDSEATSVNSWGYDAILGNPAAYEEDYAIIEELSDLIDMGRKFLMPDDRVTYYHQALEKVMDLAVELPTYQRKNLFVIDNTVVDKNTINLEADAFGSPLDRIWEVSFVRG